MKRFLILTIATTLFGCSDGYNSSSKIAGSLSCEIPNRETRSEDVSSMSVNNNEDISTYQNFIVKFKDENKVQKTDEASATLRPSGNALHVFNVKGVSFKVLAENTHTLNLDMPTEDRKKYIQSLRSDQTIEYVEPDYPIQAIDTNSEDDISSQTNDPYFSQQWMHQNVQTEKAWTITTGSKNIVVAVLDTGIDYTHKDLKDNMWINPQEKLNGIDDDNNGYIDDIYGWNFVSNNSDPRTTSRSNHGSHVAGIIGATGSNNTGIVGMAPNVRLMALRFMGDSGTGSTSGAIRGIDYAISKHVFAINNSWGSSGTSRSLGDAITRAEKAGILFLVAAGNGSNHIGFNIDRTPWYPASYSNSNVLSVAATKTDDNLTAFSNFGLSKVDVAAPGAQILSTISNQGYQNMSGTSMATPLVTGLAVLVKAANPKLTYKQVIQVIRESVDKKASLASQVASGGRVNAYKAVKLAALNINKKSDAKLLAPCP